MIAVPVTDHDMIDLTQARFLGRGVDAFRIAVAIARIAGVEQQRLAGRRDEQCRGAAFDIDPMDLQIARGRVLRERGA